jgi:predicted dithiol-disulfide oxidoreductase (DUF899 family)
MPSRVVTRPEWIEARKALLAKEKELTRLRDELAAARRALPEVRVETAYELEGPSGKVSLADAFAGRSQLLVYHFMFHPEWKAGCKSCSFWSDHFDSMRPHLAQRDVTLVAVSRAPFAKLQAFKERMGWGFPWLSSSGTTFNRDFGVTFTKEEIESKSGTYNFGPHEGKSEELPGLSAFRKDDAGAVFQTYSCYSRGLDALNGTYQLLDLVPKGRDEAGLDYPMAWVRLRDEYPSSPA